MRRIVSFCFDDGFRASAEKIVGIFETRRLRACFCVLAAPEHARDAFIVSSPTAQWAYWREVVARGHEVAPHGYAHERLSDLELEAACDSVRRTWQVFSRELAGFDPRASLFHLAYLQAPARVIEWIAARSLGVRCALGGQGRNDPAACRDRKRVDCITFGGSEPERRLEERIEQFMKKETGWLVLVLHGVDGEGWGPIDSSSLARLLDRLIAAGVEIAPPNAVLLATRPASQW